MLYSPISFFFLFPPVFPYPQAVSYQISQSDNPNALPQKPCLPCFRRSLTSRFPVALAESSNPQAWTGCISMFLSIWSFQAPKGLMSAGQGKPINFSPVFSLFPSGRL